MMLNRFWLTAALSIAFVPGLASFSSRAIAQEVEGCYFLNSSGRTVDLSSLCPGTAPQPRSQPIIIPGAPPTSGQVFQARSKRREAGTPVIDVTFNGQQTFEMIVDTGASGTVITQAMASALRAVPVGKVRVDTASQQGIELFLAPMTSLEVNGAVARSVLVAIAGPELETGLLGHDFFGNYDVTIKQDVVEFRAR